MHIKLTQNDGVKSTNQESNFVNRSIDVQHVYHHAKFEFSSFSSLANMKWMGEGGLQQYREIHYNIG